LYYRQEKLNRFPTEPVEPDMDQDTGQQAWGCGFSQANHERPPLCLPDRGYEQVRQTQTSA
jgi:hypothetical protein